MTEKPTKRDRDANHRTQMAGDLARRVANAHNREISSVFDLCETDYMRLRLALAVTYNTVEHCMEYMGKLLGEPFENADDRSKHRMVADVARLVTKGKIPPSFMEKMTLLCLLQSFKSRHSEDPDAWTVEENIKQIIESISDKDIASLNPKQALALVEFLAAGIARQQSFR
jgi:hypothetical protein